jgi:hypothetical protein
MSLSGAILEHSLVYRLWQAPFAEQEFSPVLAHNDLSRTRRSSSIIYLARTQICSATANCKGLLRA